MKCYVSNWYILKVLEDETMRPMGRVLFGEVVKDETGRFEVYSKVCTSVIDTIDADTNRVYTNSGSTYILNGQSGKDGTVFNSEIHQLRDGVTPEEVYSKRTEKITITFPSNDLSGLNN